tara:strand:+ start:1079 stop:1252 length:174 start_codon:yes stop_codon:yes gene_type:complete
MYVKLKNDVELHNFYVPAGGGDELDVLINAKFEHKISCLNQMYKYFLKNLEVNKSDI